MTSDRLSIEELATAAGLTRRGVRFYVQQKLIPAPHGVGRGKHYDHTHLDVLRRVRQFQAAGHSLDEIRHMLARPDVSPAATGGAAGGASAVVASPPASAPVRPPSAVPRPAAPRGTTLRAELWRRLRVADGVELAFDAARFNPTVEDLLALRDQILRTFRPDLAPQEAPTQQETDDSDIHYLETDDAPPDDALTTEDDALDPKPR